jgi:hypothetical protein
MRMVMEPYTLPSELWRTSSAGTPDRDWPLYMSAFRCSNESCERLSIGWGAVFQAGVGRGGAIKNMFAREVLEWEPLSIRRPGFPDVPAEIASTASEAHACLSIGAARGAVALARAVVEATAKAKGVAKEGIVGKINELRDRKIISPLTADASHAIRKDGNSIAHGDIGDEPMTVDDAQAILDFMDLLLAEVFQNPAKLQRMQQRHDERKSGA